MKIIKPLLTVLLIPLPVVAWANVYLNGVGQSGNKVLAESKVITGGAVSSRGNTFLNGSLQGVGTPAEPGDEITFGATSLTFGAEPLTF